MSRTRWTHRVLGAALACGTAIGLATLGTGCALQSRSPYTAAQAAPRNTLKAQRLHQRATLLAADPDALDEDVELLLREALAADLYHGPSHNNLGILYLGQDRLYDAATEFEWARKLMPGHPAPRVNLALALERAGKTDDALDAYDSALAVFDGYLPAFQGKARLQILSRRTDTQTAALLETIALRGDEDWRLWAQTNLLKLPR